MKTRPPHILDPVPLLVRLTYLLLLRRPLTRSEPSSSLQAVSRRLTISRPSAARWQRSCLSGQWTRDVWMTRI